MNEPPPYPPPPSEPPAGYGSVPVSDQPGMSRSFWVIITTVIAAVVLLLAALGYGVAGYAFSSSRISDASGAITTASAHRAYVNTTFDLLDQQVAAFNASTDLTMAKASAAELVNQSQTMSSTESGDDQALASVRSRLNDQQWLTPLNRGRLNAEARRLDHARTAVDTARTAASDYAQVGQFLQTYVQALTDWDTLLADFGNRDFVGAVSEDSSLQADITRALGAAGAPGLPLEFHTFLVALQSYAADVSKLLNAIAGQDKAAFDAANSLVQADIAKLDAVDFSSAPAQIKTFYQRYRDDFNSEMDKATA